MHKSCQLQHTQEEKNPATAAAEESTIGHWSDFLNYNHKNRKKKHSSRSKSMFEITDNPYADDNCYCCNSNDTVTTRNSINSSLIYSLLTSSTVNNGVASSTYASTPSLFLLKFSQVFVSCGAPSHRLDYCLQLLMQKLNTLFSEIIRSLFEKKNAQF